MALVDARAADTDRNVATPVAIDATPTRGEGGKVAPTASTTPTTAGVVTSSGATSRG